MGIASAALLLLPGAATAPEDAPVAADVTVVRVEAAVSAPDGCVLATGVVSAAYSGHRYPIWGSATPRSLCDGTNLVSAPFGIETVWTGAPDVDAPIFVRVDLDVHRPGRETRPQLQAFWFYPYGPDGDCVDKVKQIAVTAELSTHSELRFCS